MNENRDYFPDSGMGNKAVAGKSVLVRRLVGWGISLCVMAVIALMLAPVTRRAREPAWRTQCANHLKQIALALHNYHDDYGTLPPAYTTDANGTPLHSWRTLLLPYLEYQAIYDKIDLTKPWDDPANAEARATLLPSYRCPSAESARNHTQYMAIVGDDFAFSPDRPRPFSAFTDGLSRTILVMEVPAEQSCEWMEPRDGRPEAFYAISENSKTSHSGGLQVAMADGSVRFLAATIPIETRKALLTVSGGDDPGEF